VFRIWTSSITFEVDLENDACAIVFITPSLNFELTVGEADDRFSNGKLSSIFFYLCRDIGNYLSKFFQITVSEITVSGIGGVLIKHIV
jgi:hypothetical protein